MATVISLSPFASGAYDALGIYYSSADAALTSIGGNVNEVEFFEFNISSLRTDPQYYSGLFGANDQLLYTPSTSDPFDTHNITISYEFVSAAEAYTLASGNGGNTDFPNDIASSLYLTAVGVKASLGPASPAVNNGVTQGVDAASLLESAANDYQTNPGDVLVIFASETSGGFSNVDNPFFTATTCFAAGTHIATPAGEVAVERLEVGGEVLTQRGEARRIVWIGTGKVLAARGRRNAATPVIVRRGALADNVPNRDLHITKAHSLYIDDVLIPVEFLVNHRSIVWDDRAQEVSIYHIELETHDVLLANGAPAESYRDDGNRWLFQNANVLWDLPPQAPCAPVLTGGAVVDEAWRRLLERSGRRPGLPLTQDPDLHLLVDGQRLDVARRVGNAYIFELPEAPRTVRVMSRAAAPQELGLARDPRCLGVTLQRIVARQGTRFRVTEGADASLADGFHPYEPDNGFRWTRGNAALPTESFAGFVGVMEIVLTIPGSTYYVEDGFQRQAA